MSRTTRTKRNSGFRATLNLVTFAATFAVLAGSNLPVLRAVAAASVSVEASNHVLSSTFRVPAVNLTRQLSTSLPSVPAYFDTDIQLEMPAVTMAPVLPEPAVTTGPVRSAALPFGLFGSLEFRTNATKGTGVWRKALAQLDNEKPLYEFCDIGMLNCPPKYVAWRRLLTALRGLPAKEQLARLNRNINALVSHGDDADIFRVRDHWASPMEFLQTGGDCEDYTILKYASLLELGYSDQQLRIAVVKDTKRQIDHAVLAVASPQGVIILDNLTDAPIPHARIQHYRPVYSVNRRDRWVHIATKQISRMYVANTEN